MKRLLAILVFLLAAVGMAKAQDVYVSGTGYNEFGNMTAVVYRNSDLLYTQSSDNMDQLGYGVVVNPNNHNDLFWLVIEDDNQGWAASTIYRNDQQYNSLGEGSYAFRLNWCDLGTDDPNQSLFISGYRIVDGELYAAIWRGDDPTPLYSPNCGDGRQSMALGVVGVPGPSGTVDLYYGGNREDSLTRKEGHSRSRRIGLSDGRADGQGNNFNRQESVSRLQGCLLYQHNRRA